MFSDSCVGFIYLWLDLHFCYLEPYETFLLLFASAGSTMPGLQLVNMYLLNHKEQAQIVDYSSLFKIYDYPFSSNTGICA